MEFEEQDLNFDLSTVETNAKVQICNFFHNLRSELETHHDKGLYGSQTQLSSTDRLEISFKKDKFIEYLNVTERQCLNSKSEKQFIKISTRFAELNDKLVKVSHEFFFNDNLMANNNKFIGMNKTKARTASEEIEKKLQSDINELESFIFQNKTIFFVRINDRLSSKHLFGFLVTLDFYLNEEEIKILKLDF